MDDKAESDAKNTKNQRKRLDLSVAQVAGSALAAVVAALLAGKLGVYGTVIGAGVVSIVATTGGTVFQHLFKRTGEQVREATTQAARPTLRQVPVREAGRAVGRDRFDSAPDSVLSGTDPGRARPSGRTGGVPPLPEGEDHSRLLPRVSRSAAPPARPGAYPGAPDGGYSEGTVHGTRVRGWKRSLLGAGVVFALAMGGLTVVELTSGSSVSGTTVNRLVDGGGPKPKKQREEPAPQSPRPGGSHGAEDREPGKGGSTPSPGASEQGGGTAEPSPRPPTSPSGGGSSPSPDRTPGPTRTPDDGKGTGGGQPGTQPPQGQPETP